METGDIVVIDVRGNKYDGARCVYLGPWASGNGHTFHFVCHLHNSPTRDKRGALWYVRGQETGWDIKSLQPMLQKAFFCGGCGSWYEGSLDYLCESCRSN